jgi:hypothetical protein
VAVVRHSQREFERLAPDFIQCVIAHLKTRSHQFRRLASGEDTVTFVYRPTGWVLSVKVQIAARHEGDKSLVLISIASPQLVVLGNRRRYDRMIAGLFWSLGPCLSDSTRGGA